LARHNGRSEGDSGGHWQIQSPSISSAPQSKIHLAPRKPKNASADALKLFERIESEYQKAKATGLGSRTGRMGAMEPTVLQL
jgi:hypothetical protein